MLQIPSLNSWNSNSASPEAACAKNDFLFWYSWLLFPYGWLSIRGKFTGTFILTLWLCVDHYGHCGSPHGQGSWRGDPWPGNSLGQGFTSSSTLTHLLVVSGAPTGTVGGAAVGSGSIECVVALYRNSRLTRGFCGGRTQHHPPSVIAAKSRVCNANCGTGRRRSHAPTRSSAAPPTVPVGAPETPRR